MRQCNWSNCTAGINKVIECSYQWHVYVKKVKWMQPYLGKENHDSITYKWYISIKVLQVNDLSML